ncbi:MAG TPA: hypothetical protein VNQ97_05675, partial [Burkholderiaceae bacterium]|nr:hypothetical protein [Burkholderiaceae bacterium]
QISLQSGNGVKFPSLSEGEWFPATLYSANGMEIVRVTARIGDVLTVQRGQESTQPQSFSINDGIDCRLTAGALMQMLAEVEASGVVFTPTGGIVATDVQAALVELNTKKQAAGDYAPASHTHTWAQVTGKPETFPPTIGTTGDTAKAGDYEPDWDDIENKPATYPPTIGTTSTTAKAGDYAPKWGDIAEKPTGFTPTAHSHAWSDITSGVPATATRWPAWGEVTDKPSTFPGDPPSTADVAAAMTGIQQGSVGSYLILKKNTGYPVGSVRPGSNFQGNPPGTYLVMGISCELHLSEQDPDYFHLVLRLT